MKMELRSKSIVNEDRKSAELVIRFISTYIGHGVFTKKNIKKATFLCIYPGECISKEEGDRRYKKKENSSFLFWFWSDGKALCIDGTHASGVGRMINDSKTPNCRVKVLHHSERGSVPKLGIFAIKDIKAQTELVFNYGDNSVPWRKKNAEKKALFPEPDFMTVTAVVVVISRNGKDSAVFPLVNRFCFIGRARNCDIIVSRDDVEEIHCQLEVYMGEVFLTYFSKSGNQPEQQLHIGDEFQVGGRLLRIEKEPSEVSVTGNNGFPQDDTMPVNQAPAFEETFYQAQSPDYHAGKGDHGAQEVSVTGSIGLPHEDTMPVNQAPAFEETFNQANSPDYNAGKGDHGAQEVSVTGSIGLPHEDTMLVNQAPVFEETFNQANSPDYNAGKGDHGAQEVAVTGSIGLPHEDTMLVNQAPAFEETFNQANSPDYNAGKGDHGAQEVSVTGSIGLPHEDTMLVNQNIRADVCSRGLYVMSEIVPTYLS